jgi:hypothetical protein
MHDGVRALVNEAIAAGELRRCDAGRLAWALLATLNGSVLNWTVQREGELSAWIRRDLKTFLEPYKAARPRSR